MDGHVQGDAAEASDAKKKKEPGPGQENEPLRKLFWAIMMAASAASLFGLLLLIPAPPEASSAPKDGTLWQITQLRLEWLQLRLRGSEHLGAPSLLVAILAFIGSGLMLTTKREEQRSVLVPLLVGVVVMGLGGVLLPSNTLWGWVLALIPPLLIVHHALFLSFIKSKSAFDSTDKYYSAQNIALRYGVPAMAVFIVGSAVFHGLNPVTDWSFNKVIDDHRFIHASTLEAARLGAVGAYIYVLLYLGQRSFQHDLSSGSVLWCSVTLVVGPLMAAVFSKIWAPTGTETAGWTTQAFYLAVGMTPRYTAQQIASLMQRLSSRTAPAEALVRSLPLSKIRGITPRIEERLIEEGIDDVAALAMAAPERLQRNTNFHTNQLLSWIDSALLINALPEDYEELENKGVRGARDLVWCLNSSETAQAEAFAALSTEQSEQQVFRHVALRLRDDAQAMRIRALYQDGHNKPASTGGLAQVTQDLSIAAAKGGSPDVTALVTVPPPVSGRSAETGPQN